MGEQKDPVIEKEGVQDPLLQLHHWAIDIKREEVQRTLGMREGLLRFLKWAFGASLAVTLPAFLAALFLTGWKSKTGFEISDAILMFLGGLTIGQIAGLITTAITAFLKIPSAENHSSG